LNFECLHTDHLNTPRKVTRPSDNQLRWRWDPDPFGASAPNQNPQGLGTFVYHLRLPGQYFDTETALHYNYFRNYDPQIGRYLESDPVGLKAGVNTYAYVGGNPLSYTDVLGLIRRCMELWSFRDYESKDWSTIQTLYGKEFLAPGRGGGQLSPGAGLNPPTSRSPGGGISPSVDVRLMLWWVRWMQTKGEEGYMLRSFIRGYMECREDDLCKDPAITHHTITRDYTPWKSVATREVNENELEWLRPYGEVSIPVPLPGMPR
jgi:RHS repeat-associated protein